MLSLKELCCIVIKTNNINIINFPDLEYIYNEHLNYYCTSCNKYIGKDGLLNKSYHNEYCKWDYNLYCYGCGDIIYCNNKNWVSTCVPDYNIYTGTYCDNVIGCSRYCDGLRKYIKIYKPCFNCYKLCFCKSNCDCYCSDECELIYKVKYNFDKCLKCNHSFIYGFPYNPVLHICKK